MHWVEACIVFIRLPGTTILQHPEPTANEVEDNHKVRMEKNPMDPGYDLGGGAYYFGREVYLSDVMLMSAVEVQGFVCAWVEAYILPGTTVTSGTNRQRRGTQPKSLDGEKKSHI